MGQPIVRYESGQTSYAFEAMTDSGDNTTFSASFSPFSKASGFAPTVCPYGLKSGGAITPGSSNDEVDVAALSLCAPGMSGADADGTVAVSAASGISVSRGLTTDTHRITSITVDSTGAVVAVAGVDHTAFSETRGADGGPPFIPVGSVEVGQVRVSSITAGLILTTEIYTVPGLHRETAGNPSVNRINYVDGTIVFASGLPLIHTGGLPKKVYIKGAVPIFADLGYSSDWSPANETYSTTSTDTYDGAVAESSASVGSASFTAQLNNGVEDSIIALLGQDLWIEYRPDRNVSTIKQLTLGKLSVSWTQAPSSSKVQGSFQVAATTKSENFS